MVNRYSKKRVYKKARIIKVLVIIFLLVVIIFYLNKMFAVNINKNQINEVKEIENNIKEKDNCLTIEKNNNDKIIDVILEKSVDNNTKSVYNIDNNSNGALDNVNKKNSKNFKFGDNVAFIGNSRTQAFLMYTGLKDVVDYTYIGLMVDTAITKKFITDSNGNKVTLLEDLKSKNVDRIYIMLGINELGWVYSSIFIQKYEELIDKIKEIKPNCEIIVQSIIPVTKTKSDNDKIYNNNRIKVYNDLIKDMAKRKNIKYIDLVSTLTGKNGCLPEDAAIDGIHLNKEYCLKWLEKLKEDYI